MLSKLRKWLGLAPWERRAALAFAVMLPLIAASLRLVGFRRTTDWIGLATRGSSPYPTTSLRQAQRIAELAALVGTQGLVQVKCLPQALGVRLALRKRGQDCVLKFGVRKDGIVMDLHAWVEWNGIALAQPNLRHRPFQ